jgi:hypothetical protein
VGLGSGHRYRTRIIRGGRTTAEPNGSGSQGHYQKYRRGSILSGLIGGRGETRLFSGPLVGIKGKKHKKCKKH